MASSLSAMPYCSMNDGNDGGSSDFSPAGAPATIANGVMYVCSGGPSGYMYALDAATGSLLWSFASGARCGAGATVADGVVYWGTGYAELFLEQPQGGKLYAFELPRRGRGRR